MRFLLLAPPMRLILLAFFLLIIDADAQWRVLHSNTSASLRGIDSVNGKDGTPTGIVWASGTSGTVLRTIDGGEHWIACAIPQDATTLDFRGIQAWDAQNAIVMSSGPGDQSRLYKTSDGCKSWVLLAVNPDRDGFWDAMVFPTRRLGFVLGDPVASSRPGREPRFALYVTEDGGAHFRRWSYSEFGADPKSEGAFAASNSSLLVSPSEGLHGWLWFTTGGEGGARVYNGIYVSEASSQVSEVKSEVFGIESPGSEIGSANGASPITSMQWDKAGVALASGPGAGGFSIAARGHETDADRDWIFHANLVAVGGYYNDPDAARRSAVYSVDGGKRWHASARPPSGYRSAVAYDETLHAFIAVGPTGTDASFDGGKTFRPIESLPGDEPGANRDWNALSLPFVVGPNGRIGKLEVSLVPPKR